MKTTNGKTVSTGSQVSSTGAACLGPADWAIDEVYRTCDRVAAQLAPCDLDDLRAWPQEPILLEAGMRHLLERYATQHDGLQFGWYPPDLEEFIEKSGGPVALLNDKKLRTARDLAHHLLPIALRSISN
jgi:hypothetical protein